MKKIATILSIVPLMAMANYDIHSKVWYDMNQDWEQNNNEPNYPNVEVILYDEDGDIVDCIKTDDEGYYQFSNKEEGEYSIKVIPPKEATLVTDQIITTWLDEDRDDINFGIYKPLTYSITGTVWNDENKDWEMGKNEKKIRGVKIELYNEDKEKIATTQTNNEGNYSFSNLDENLYIVKVIKSKEMSIITDDFRKFWLEENMDKIDFGVFTSKIPPINEPITREQLIEMIKNNEDVTEVNTSKITNMSRLFKGNHTFNQDISDWDTSNVTNMNEMFAYAYAFNQPIGKWDVSKVRNMSQMFRGVFETYVMRLYSTAFNQDLSNWDVSNVETMYKMFYGSNINQDLTKWDVSNVTSWKGIFEKIRIRSKRWLKMEEKNKPKKFLDDNNSEEPGYKEEFYGNFSEPPSDLTKPITRKRLLEMISNQQDVTEVNTSNITDMSRLFYNQVKFNQDISAWDTSKVTDMHEMFKYAYSFNQPIGKWDVSNVTNMASMFRGYWYKGRYKKIIKHQFNQDLSTWNVSNVTDMNHMLAISDFMQDVSKWDVSNVINWRYIFSHSLRHSNYGNMKKELMPEKLSDLKGKL